MATPVAKCSEYRGGPETIDHILASSTLIADQLPDITTITPQGDALPSTADDPNAQRNEPRSDHAAVIAKVHDPTLTLHSRWPDRVTHESARGGDLVAWSYIRDDGI